MPEILRLKCTKFGFRWGSLRFFSGNLQRSPNPLAVFKGPTLYIEGRNGRGRVRRKGEGKER